MRDSEIAQPLQLKISMKVTRRASKAAYYIFVTIIIIAWYKFTEPDGGCHIPSGVPKANLGVSKNRSVHESSLNTSLLPKSHMFNFARTFETYTTPTIKFSNTFIEMTLLKENNQIIFFPFQFQDFVLIIQIVSQKPFDRFHRYIVYES